MADSEAVYDQALRAADHVERAGSDLDLGAYVDYLETVHEQLGIMLYNARQDADADADALGRAEDLQEGA